MAARRGDRLGLGRLMSAHGTSQKTHPPVLTSPNRHFRSGSLALASLNHTCRNLVPTFPQRSPPWLLTTAACGGLRSTPDCSKGPPSSLVQLRNTDWTGV